MVVKAPTRTSARGRSKSRTRAPKNAEESTSPVRKSKRKTPKKSAKKAKAKPVSESEESEAEVDVEEEEVEVSVTPAKKKTPTKKKSATKAAKAAAAPAAHADKEVFGTTIVCRLMYLQLFAAGLGAIYGPFEVMKLAYGDSIESNELTVNAQRWLGVFILQLSFAVIAGAQGNHADQKKTLQYLMFLPLMFIAMVVSHVDVMRPEFLNGVVAASMLDLGLMIWGCYYSD